MRTEGRHKHETQQKYSKEVQNIAKNKEQQKSTFYFSLLNMQRCHSGKATGKQGEYIYII